MPQHLPWRLPARAGTADIAMAGGGGAPRALRVATLHGRLVLQDVTAHLRGRDPCARNALIDAANAATRAAATVSRAQPSLVDLPAPRAPSAALKGAESGGGGARYLVIPFDGGDVFETGDATVAGIDDVDKYAAPVDAAAGFLGVLRLCSAAYAVLVSQIRRAGSLPSGDVLTVHRVKLLKLGGGPPAKMDREFCGAIAKLLEGGALYYSLDADLTRSLDKASEPGAEAGDGGGHGGGSAGGTGGARIVGNAFWWTWPMARRGGPVAACWSLRTIYGYVGTEAMRFATGGASGGSRRGGDGGFNGVGASADDGQRGELALPKPGAGAGTRDFLLTLVSRRSRRRAGTRYIMRGVDGMGDVANFVETEQVVWAPAQPGIYSSFTVIRGSVPVFWRQNNGIAKPSPELESTITASRSAFSSHFRNMVRSYGGVVVVSLVDMHGSEAVLAEAFERHFQLDVAGSFDGLVEPKLVSFDFHARCGGKEYERGLASLLSCLQADVQRFGFFTRGIDVSGVPKRQSGVFRVNCVDCLDRTNVVQSMLARVALDMQLRAVFHSDLRSAPSTKDSERSHGRSRLYHDSEDRFKHVWGDNADAVSKQYSGTGALKTDFTRTGKRSTQGMLGDGVKSMVRMYYKNFIDEGRQEAIDILCGNASVRPRAGTSSTDNLPLSGRESSGDLTRAKAHATTVRSGEGLGRVASTRNASQDPDSDASELWYSFNALRLNGGGDKQQVLVELRDNAMLLATPEGVNFEYPRHGLLLWDKCEDAKSGDRKQPSRLRLVYRPSAGAPAAASPLDLLFRGGPTARETFIRAYLSWAQPKVIEDFDKPVRIRVLSARGVSKHRMADWGLDGSAPASERAGRCEGREVVALIVPEGHSDTREWGLAAVPLDIDRSNYVLVSARAVSSRGPAIAVLASKEAAPSVMSVSESMIGRAGSLTGGGAVGVSLLVCGTTLCFVSARLGGAKDLFRVLSTLKLRRSMFDVTNQFEHFYIAGVMGDLQWRNGNVPDDGPEARKYLSLGDGSKAYSLGNGLSVMHNSFPELPVLDILDHASFWHRRRPNVVAASEASKDSSGVHAEGASAPFPGSQAHQSQEMLSAPSLDDKAGVTSLDGPALSIAMVDEIVGGRPAPSLPNPLSRCVITISELRGEGIKMPPGIDQSTPLNTFFAVYSDYVGADPVVTRPTGRPTDRPEWQEAVRLNLVPSDVDEIRQSFLLCQVMIPMPLADPIPAGHCVLPVSFASDGRAEFTIPLRLAGIATGRVRGIIELESSTAKDEVFGTRAGSYGDDLFGLDDGDLDAASSGRGVSSEDRQNRAGAAQRQKSLVPLSGVSSMGMSGPVLQSTPSLDEVNDKLDMARRKGSKQIKSMVGKLSSLLGQPATSGGASSAAFGSSNSSRPGALPVDRRTSTGGGSGLATRPASADVYDSDGCITETEGKSGFGVLNSALPPARPDWSRAPALPNAPSPHTSRANSRTKPTRNPDPLLAGLASSAKSEKYIPHSPPESGGVAGDPLFASLSRGESHEAPSNASAVLGEDDLLAGLRAAKVTVHEAAGEMEDDDWGTFEEASAMTAIPSTSSRASSGAHASSSTHGGSTTNGNLLDL